MRDIVEQASKDYGIDFALLCSIISVESGWNPKVMRYEPGWRWLVNPPEFAHSLGITYDTEVQMQKFSYGLSQIMGGKAREQGFTGFLTDLLDPKTNVTHCAIFLKALWSKHGYEPDVISSYNQGSPIKTPGGMYRNQVYVDKVSGYLRDFRKLV